MKKFLARVFTLYVVSLACLATIAIVVASRILAYAGTKFVEWCAAKLNVTNPFASIMATNSAPRQADPADYAAIEIMVNSKIPSKAERQAARDALQRIMAP